MTTTIAVKNFTIEKYEKRGTCCNEDSLSSAFLFVLKLSVSPVVTAVINRNSGKRSLKLYPGAFNIIGRSV